MTWWNKCTVLWSRDKIMWLQLNGRDTYMGKVEKCQKNLAIKPRHSCKNNIEMDLKEIWWWTCALYSSGFIRFKVWLLWNGNELFVAEKAGNFLSNLLLVSEGRYHFFFTFIYRSSRFIYWVVLKFCVLYDITSIIEYH